MSHVQKLVKDEIASCKQDGQSVLEYYGRITKLWQELANYQTGRACRCEAAQDIEKEREDDRVHQFLFGLDLPRFENLRFNITHEYPLPSLNKVYSRVIRDEEKLNRMKETTKADATGFADKSSLSCTPYNRQGHEVTECFLVHGYPDRYYKQNHRAGAIPSDNMNTSNGSHVEYRPVQRGGPPTQGTSRGRGRANNARFEWRPVQRVGCPTWGTSSGRGTANNARATSTSDSGNDQIAHQIQAPEAQRPNTSSQHIDSRRVQRTSRGRGRSNIVYRPKQRGGSPTRAKSPGRGRANNDGATSTPNNDNNQIALQIQAPEANRPNNSSEHIDSKPVQRTSRGRGRSNIVYRPVQRGSSRTWTTSRGRGRANNACATSTPDNDND